MIERRDAFGDDRARYLAGRQGLFIFLGSLGMLFAATLIGFVVIRLSAAGDWPDLPPLPRVLYASTAVLLVSSCTVQAAANRAARDARAVGPLAATLGLGLAFLAIQAVAWVDWLDKIGPLRSVSDTHRFALASFYVMTALHALHVVGGLVPLAVVTVREGTRRTARDGIIFCAAYWHFLGVVWVVLFASLLIGS